MKDKLEDRILAELKKISIKHFADAEVVVETVTRYTVRGPYCQMGVAICGPETTINKTGNVARMLWDSVRTR
jgi:hypothetical protein